MEYNQLDGMFLTKFFTILAVTGENYKDKERMFHSLAQAYCLAEEKENALYQVVETEEISSIRCLEEYVATTRALDYQARFGTPLEIADDIRFALDCKGKALKSIYPLIADCGKNPTKAQFKTSLAKQEIRNLIAVSFVAAFMNFEGIFLAKDVRKAIGFAEKCAAWNSIDGLMLLLRYGEESKKGDYKNALATLIRNLQSEEEFSAVIKQYGLATCSGKREANLLIAKYIERVPDMLIRETFDESVVTIAESSLISVSDKERILDSGDRAALSVIGDFAFTVRRSELSEEKHVRNFLAGSRHGEANQVEICLRKQSAYDVKIPILVCRSKVVVAQYCSAVKKFVGDEMPIVYLDARNCSQGNFAQTKSNIVVKTLVSAKHDGAMFVITDADKISEEKSELLLGVLNPDNRRRYLLQDANLTLDLSKCIFLLIAEGENVPDNIRNFCQIIGTENASKEESREYVESFIDKYKTAYECSGISFDEEAITFLENKDPDRIAQVVEALCRKHSFEEENVVVSKADIMRISAVGETSQMAFQIKK